MFRRRVDCKKYWKWKRQQERKSKKGEEKVKKRKRKDSVTDCIEVEQSEVPVTVLKARPKIKKKKKDTLAMKPLIKRVPLTELVLRSIQPPMEIRQQFLNPRHIDCLQLASLDIEILSPEILQATTSLLSQTHEADQIKDPKKWKPGAGKRSSPKEIDAKKIEDSELEEESECKSICSADSEVCLEGTKLTPKDKEEIKKYHTQKDSAKEEEEK